MKPEVVEQWPLQDVVDVAYALMYKDYRATTKAAAKLPGIGVYSKEHLYRTWLVIQNKKHLAGISFQWDKAQTTNSCGEMALKICFNSRKKRGGY